MLWKYVVDIVQKIRGGSFTDKTLTGYFSRSLNFTRKCQ